MSKHVFACALTSHGVSANNRGDNQGNITTLRKILLDGREHSSVSGEALRAAWRLFLQENVPDRVNRQSLTTPEGLGGFSSFKNPDFAEFAQGHVYADDDLYGFMLAGTRSRRGAVDVGNAVSLTPYSGDVVFNAARPGSSAGADKGKPADNGNPVLYSAEVHATRYQYTFGLSMDGVRDPENAVLAVRAVCGVGRVAGNHARFLFDFSPESIVFRLTDEMAPRICNVFKSGSQGNIDIDLLAYKTEAGDIDPKELYVGGPIVATESGQRLGKLGANVFSGVKATEKAVIAVIESWIGETPKKKRSR